MNREATQQNSEFAMLCDLVFRSCFVRFWVIVLLGSFLLQPINLVFAEGDGDSDAVSAVTVTEPEPEPEVEPEPEPPVREESELESEADDSASSPDESAGQESTVSEEASVSDGAEADESAVDAATDNSSESDTSNEDSVNEAGEQDLARATTSLERASSSTQVDTRTESQSSDSNTDGTSTIGAQSGGGGASNVQPEESESARASSTATSTAAEDIATATTTSTTSPSATSTNPEGQTESQDASDIVNEQSNGSNESEEVASADSNENDLTSATASTSPTIVYAVQTSDANRYQFSVDQCVDVGDGSFYCSKTERPRYSTDAAVLVQADNDGDKEIYLRDTSGMLTKLSDNRLDDLAPYYDELSKSVVWHRLDGGQYEIVAYDLESKEETVLTSNSVNDMEPSRSGDHTVWQRWIDDNWEIILFNGESEVRLTTNSTHDIAPHIKGDFVIWHSNNGVEQVVSVYEIETGLTSTISDTDGGAVKNPRFVLVYDTAYENGDVVTKGYDFETGAVVPLGATPAVPLPDIPSPESTGETKALIQNKTHSPEEELDALIEQKKRDRASTTSRTSQPDSVVASSTTEAIEVVNEPVLDLRTEAATSIDTVFDPEFDLVVPPRASSSQSVDMSTSSNPVE